MEIILLSLGLGLGAAIAWRVVVSTEQTKHGTRIRDLESRVRLSYQETSKLKEAIASRDGQLTAIRDTIRQERSEHANRYLQMGDAFKNALMITGFVTFTMTFVFAASVSWYTASIWSDTKKSKQLSEMELNAHLYKHDKEALESKIASLTRETQSLRAELIEAKIDKEVALTKLDILLKSLSFQGGVQGFSLDFHKLKKNLTSHSKKQPDPNHLAPIKSAWV